MKPIDRLFFLLCGILIWVVGTLWYRARGPVVLETTSLRYWSNFIAMPIASTVLCLVLLRLRHVPASAWAAALLLVALPGMFGEAILLTRFTAFMPGMQAATGSKYAALLFASYAMVLSIAEIVTLRAH